MFAMETKKGHILSHNSNGYKEKKLHQKHYSYRSELPLKKEFDWISTTEEKMLQHQKCTF